MKFVSRRDLRNRPGSVRDALRGAGCGADRERETGRGGHRGRGTFAFPDRFEDAVLTVSLANAYTWHRDVPWWDLEVLGNAGANDDGLGSSDRVPAPTTLTFSLRVRF